MKTLEITSLESLDAANREKIKAYARAYRAANREKIKAYARAYRAANREKIKAYARDWQAANREKLRKRVMGLETQIDYDNECIERIRGHGMILELKLARFKAVLLELEQFISKVGHPKSCGQSMDYMGLTPDDTPACSCDKDKTLAAIRKLREEGVI